MLPNLGPLEWVLILLVLILLFGAKKLPDTARALGQSLKIFKKETSRTDDEPAPAPPAAPQQQQALPPTAQSLEERARRLEEEAARLRAQAAGKDQQQPS